MRIYMYVSIYIYIYISIHFGPMPPPRVLGRTGLPTNVPGSGFRPLLFFVLINKAIFSKQIIFFFERVIFLNNRIKFSKQIINLLRNAHISDRENIFLKQRIKFLGTSHISEGRK